MNQSAQNQTFLAYQPLVRKIALAIASKVPAHISRDDLISAGNLGLVQALRQMSPDSDPDGFAAYASARVRGAVLDELRRGDPLSRRDRRAVSRVKRAEQQLRARHGHTIPPAEVANHCGIDADEYQRLKCAELANQTEEIQENTCWSRYGDIPALCDARFIRHLIAELPERLQVVVDGYFQEDLSLRQVGERLGVSESRAHQLLKAAIRELKRLVEEPHDDSPVSLRKRIAPLSIAPAAAAA